MNNGIVITDSAKFQEVINSFEASFRNIKNIVDKEKKNVERINQTEIWSGGAARAMYSQYSLLNSNYDPIVYSLDIYIRFLKKTLEDYVRIDYEISKNADDMSASLDVNS